MAGISQPYLFRLFGTKKDLFLAVVQMAFDLAQSTLVDAAGDRTGEEAMAAIDKAYGTLLEDRTLLLAQLQAYAACGDDDVRCVTRNCFAKMWQAVAKSTRLDDRRLADFFGRAFQLTMAAAMDFTALTGLPGESPEGVPIPPGACATSAPPSQRRKDGQVGALLWDKQEVSPGLRLSRENRS